MRRTSGLGIVGLAIAGLAVGAVCGVSARVRAEGAAGAPKTEAGAKTDAAADGLWSVEKANQWYSRQGWLCGFNYVPANCINSTEMWQKETFDLKSWDAELALSQKIGFNCMRVLVQYLVWDADPEGLMDRLDRFLALSEKRGLKVMPVLFDDCVFGPKSDPYLGKQADMIKGWYAHDWSPSPGHSRVKDRAAWPRLEQYVRDVVGRFKDDPRVLAWDIYNEPTNGIGDVSLPLVEKAYQWTRAAQPSQPLTLDIWNGNARLNALALRVSDVISFHNYGNAAAVEKQVLELKKTGRPVLCTEWLKRQCGSVETILPVFERHKVGCMHWGLVNGKTQTQYGWGSKAGAPEPKVWQHDLFRGDFTPYDPREIEIFTQAVRKVKP